MLGLGDRDAQGGGLGRGRASGPLRSETTEGIGGVHGGDTPYGRESRDEAQIPAPQGDARPPHMILSTAGRIIGRTT